MKPEREYLSKEERELIDNMASFIGTVEACEERIYDMGFEWTDRHRRYAEKCIATHIADTKDKTVLDELEENRKY